MKIAVIVLWGLTFATFLTLFVCWAKVGLAVFRIHTYVRSHDHSIPFVFTPNTLKRIHEYFVCHKCCVDADEESRRLRLVDPRTERRLLILWGVCMSMQALSVVVVAIMGGQPLFALATLPVLLFAVLFALAVHYLMSKLRWAFNP